MSPCRHTDQNRELTNPQYKELFQLIQSLKKEICDVRLAISDQPGQKVAHSPHSQLPPATQVTNNSNVGGGSSHGDISMSSVEFFIPDNPVNQIDLNF